VRLSVRAPDPHVLDKVVEGLNYLGAATVVDDARFEAAEADGILPDDFYSTTNFDTYVRTRGVWQPAQDQKMDCALVIRDGAPRCVKQGQVRKGEPVALRGPGIRVRPPERSRDVSVFGFMSNEISAETNKGIVIAGTANELRKTREAGEKIVVVAGPAIVHSGATRPRAPREGRLGRRAPDRQRLRDPRPREVDPQDEPGSLPAQRASRWEGGKPETT
jgi:hypothetical protein